MAVLTGISPIHNAPHGFREFGVQDPDGHDIAAAAYANAAVSQRAPHC
jgi:hypothetical protein